MKNSLNFRAGAWAWGWNDPKEREHCNGNGCTCDRCSIYDRESGDRHSSLVTVVVLLQCEAWRNGDDARLYRKIPRLWHHSLWLHQVSDPSCLSLLLDRLTIQCYVCFYGFLYINFMRLFAVIDRAGSYIKLNSLRSLKIVFMRIPFFDLANYFKWLCNDFKSATIESILHLFHSLPNPVY